MVLEAAQALTTLEAALRVVTREVLGENWKTSFTASQVARFDRSRTRDLERRHGVCASGDLLDYTETTDLTKIIRENWETFAPVFHEKERTFGFPKVLDDMRYSVAHSRDLVPFERDLISGINGQLRQQIALWRNRDDPSTRFYPRIESVKDNYGIEGREEVHVWASTPRTQRLSVGDVLTFTGSAYGQQERPVLWYVRRYGLDNYTTADIIDPVQAEGDRAELTYTIIESDVAETFSLHVYISTQSRYHRKGTAQKYDDSRSFTYAVDPPPEQD